MSATTENWPSAGSSHHWTWCRRDDQRGGLMVSQGTGGEGAGFALIWLPSLHSSPGCHFFYWSLVFFVLSDWDGEYTHCYDPKGIIFPDYIWLEVTRLDRLRLGHVLLDLKLQCCGSGMFIPDPDFFHPGSNKKRGGKKISCLTFFGMFSLSQKQVGLDS